MMKKFIPISMLFIASYAHLSAQVDTNISTIAIDTIEFTYNEVKNIVVQAILNQEDSVSLMFHTDIGSVSLTPEMTSLLISKEKKSSNSKSWTGSKKVSYTENNTLKIANLIHEQLLVWVDMLSGPETDGKFGPNLFENKIIEINNDQQFIALHEPGTLQLDNRKYLKFELSTNETNSLFLEGKIRIDNQTVINKFLIHSGYGGTIILDDEYVTSNPILQKLPTIEENDLKDSFGNVIKTKKVMIDSFEFGNIRLNDLPISYFDSKIEIQKTSVMGCEILRRCNMYIDIENLEVHIAPNDQTKELFRI